MAELEQNDSQQNEPQQINRPPQYPTATRIEDGVAYDISGKALGKVDEGQLAPAGQSSAPQDPFAGLSGVEVKTAKPAAAQSSGSQDPFAGLSGVDVTPQQKNTGGAGGSWEPAKKPGLIARVLGSGDPLQQLITEVGMTETGQKAFNAIGNAVAGPNTLLGGGGVGSSQAGDPTEEEWNKIVAAHPNFAEVSQKASKLPHDEYIREMSKLGPDVAEIMHRQDTATNRMLASNNMTSTPLVDISALVPAGHPLAKGVAEALSGFTSPQNLALMVATGGFGEFASSAKGAETVSRLVSLGFTGDMIRGLYGEGKELKAAFDKGDWDKVKEIGGQMAVTASMVGMAGYHGVTGEALPILPDYLVGKETKATRVAAKAAIAADSVAKDAQTSEAVLNSRTSEAARGVTQASKARADAEAAEAAERNGTGTREQTIAAQENASAAAADAAKKQKALKDAQDAHSANLVKHAQLTRNAENANTELAKIKADREAKAQEKEDANADNFGLLGKISEGYKDWHDQRELEKTARQKLSPTNAKVVDSEFGKAFRKIYPATKSASYDSEDLQVAETYLANHRDTEGPIEDNQEMHTALQHQVDSIDDTIGAFTEGKFSNEHITTNPVEAARKALSVVGSLKEGFLDKGMAELALFPKLDNPTLKEAVDINSLFNSELRAIREKSIGGDRRAQSDFTLRQTSPEFAAIDAAQKELRLGIDGGLKKNGVSGSIEMRRDQSRLINIKNAVDRQMFKDESLVRGTRPPGVIRKLASKSASTLGTAGGAAAGGWAAGPVGAIGGAVVGKELGTKVGEALYPPNLTRDAAVAKMIPTAKIGNGPKGLEIREILPTNTPWAPDYTPAPRGGALGSVTTEETRPARTVDLPDIALANRGGVIRRQPVTPENRGLMLPPGPPEPRMLPPRGGAGGPIPVGPSTTGAPIAQLNPTTSENTPFHADLATHYGETVGETPYQELEDRFRSDVAIKKEHGVPLDSSEKSLLKAMNTTDVQKIVEWRKQQEEAAKEAEKAADIEAKLQQKRVEKEAKIEAPFEVGPELEMPDGFLEPSQLRRHEAGHLIVGDALGFPAIDITSHLHPLADPGDAQFAPEQARARFDKSALYTDSGRFSDAKLAARLGDVVTLMYGGPVAQELFDGIEIDDNPSAYHDIDSIMQLFKRYGLSDDEINNVIEQAKAQARSILAPHEDIVRKYTQYREAGIPDQYHMVKGTVAKMLEEIRGEDNETDDDNKPVSKSAIKEGAVPVAGGKGENEGGAASVRGNGKLGAEGEGVGGEGVTRPVSRKVAELSEGRVIPDDQRADALEREIANDKDLLSKNPTEEERRVLQERLQQNRNDLRELYAKPTPKVEASARMKNVPHDLSFITPEGKTEPLRESETVHEDAARRILKKLDSAYELPAKNEAENEAQYELMNRGWVRKSGAGTYESNAKLTPAAIKAVENDILLDWPELKKSKSGVIIVDNGTDTHEIPVEDFIDKYKGDLNRALKATRKEPSLEAKAQAAQPKERTTGDKATDEVIKAAGAIPGGVSDFGPGLKLTMMHDPTTGSTLAFRESEAITPGTVAEKLRQSREAFQAAKEPKLNASVRQAATVSAPSAPEILDAMREKYGESSDATGVRDNASFITSNGKFIHLPSGMHHADAVRVNGGTGLFAPYETGDVRPAFLQDSGVIRTRHSYGAGREILQVSVPPQGVTSEQLTSLKRAVGEGLGTSGQLYIERGDIISGRADELSAHKDFVRPSDVDSLLRKIGAYPDQGERLTSDQEKGLISARVPQSAKSTEDPLKQDLKVDRAAIDQVPGMKDKMADLVREYPGFRIADNIKDPDKVIDRFVDHLKKNLISVYNKVSPERIAANKQWYDSANKLATKTAGKYGTTVPQQAGVIAAMSPQRDWNQNVSLADRVNDIYHNQKDTTFSPEMAKMGAEIASRPSAGVFKKIVPQLEGKKLSDLTDLDLRAAWIRLFDEAHNSKDYQDIDPATGEGRGLVKTGAGENRKVSWGGLSEIGKAISILDDGSRENISNNLGDAHKVRNFYNNLLDPNNPAGHVTIDTHAVAAALIRPLGGNATEVLHNFGAGGAPSSVINGISGTYPLYAEAYRAAAQELGLQPRQLQSIVWEEIRNMFPGELKRVPTHTEAINSIWKSYDSGKISLDKAQGLVREYSIEANKAMAEKAAKKNKTGKLTGEEAGLNVLRGKK